MVRFLVLGPLEARVDGRELEIGGGKQRALLALLLIRANEVVASERLVEDLWSGRPPPSAAKLVQGYVSQLRRALGSDAIVTVGPGYVLRAGETDAAEFERLLREVREQGLSPRQAVPRLRSALALWRGQPFADVAYEHWAQVEIGQLEEQRLVAVEELLAARMELGEAGELVPELQAHVREHPLRERFWSQLMLALYRCGRQAEALDAYQQARRALVEELGIEPTRRLRELEQAILRQDPALEVVEVAAAVNAADSVLVGRERELSELLAGLDDAFASRGRLFLLQGEPGIGKSRLADELAARARARGAYAAIGRCWEAGGAPAFWPWVQLLRSLIKDAEPAMLSNQLGTGAAELAQLVPELRGRFPDLVESSQLDSEGARFRLFDAVSSFLRSAADAQPVVLFLDDLHAADQSSLVLLQFVARELAQSRLLVLAAYRDVDPTMSESLVGALAELMREPPTRRLSLSGLPELEVGQFIELVSGQEPPGEVVTAINEEAEGNPFFVGEIVRMLVAEGEMHREHAPRLDIPQSVREVIARRLRHLSERCNELLILASVLGRDFGVEELAQLAELSHDELLAVLEEAMAEKVVSDAPGAAGRLRFAHLLIRDTLYHGLTPTRRARLHRQAGEAVETVYTRDLDLHLAELAHHFLAGAPAGSADKAIDYARRAGDRAARLLAFEEAVRLYDTALQLVREDSVRASLLERWAQAVQPQGRLQEARTALKDALAVYREHNETVAAGRVLTVLSNVLWRVGDPRKDEPLAEALALLEAEPPGPELVTAYAERAGHRALDADYPEAIVAAERALDLAHELGMPEPARALGYRGAARATLGEVQGIEDMRRALSLAVDQGEGRAAAVLHNNIAEAVSLYEGPRSALAACQDGIDFCQAHGIGEWALYISSTSLRFLVWCGRLEQALAEAEPIAEQAQANSDPPVLVEARSLQLRLNAHRGAGAELLATAENVEATARKSGEPQQIAVGFAAASQLFAVQGQPQRAEALLSELEQIPRIRGLANYQCALPEIVRCALVLGNRQLGASLVAGVEPRTPLAAHALITCKALLTEQAGKHAAAAALYAEAANRWQEFGNLPEHAHALLGHGRCLLTIDHAHADVPLREAGELFASMGYKPALAETKALLQRTAAAATS